MTALNPSDISLRLEQLTELSVVKELDGYAVQALSSAGYEGNLTLLQNTAMGGGFYNADFDADGLLRWAPLMMRVGDAYYESLALATARAALGASTTKPVFLQSDALQSQEDVR